MEEGNNANNTNNANMSSNSTPLNPAEAAAQALTAASDTADGTSAGGSAGAGGGIGGNAAGGSDGGRTGGNGSGRKKWLISAGAAAAVVVVGGGVMLSHQADPKDTVIDAFKSITAEGQLNPSEEIFGTKELEKLLQNKSQILLVDDSKMNRMILKEILGGDYSILEAENGQECLEKMQAEAGNIALVLLDIMMPRVDGLTVLRTLRARGSALPVLLLTARDAVADRVDGLDAGADDYLIKPFALDELLARLRVLTRKKGSGSTNVYTLADLTVDTAARTAKRGGRTLELSAREYALLEYLIRSKGVVLSRQQIEDNLWSLDYAGGTNVVDVYISYLRKKLELPGERKLLHTVRGMGWVLKEDA